MDGDELVREISKRTGYTIQDSRLFYNALISVFADCVASQTPINARGFLHLNYKTIPPRKGNVQSDVIARKEDPSVEIRKTEFPETVRANIKLARNLKGILRESIFEEEVEDIE